MVVQASGGLSGGAVAGLIVAVFWGVLVCFLAYVLIKLGKVIGEAAKLVSIGMRIRGGITSHGLIPTLSELLM